MSVSNKVRLVVEVYKEETEFHEIILTKEEHEKLKNWDEPEHITDYISEKTVMYVKEGNWDYEIKEEGEVSK
jgi:hypothetical protein